MGQILLESAVEAPCNATQIKEILVEESNVQPVNSPVTVRHSGICQPLPLCCTAALGSGAGQLMWPPSSLLYSGAVQGFCTAPQLMW